MSSCLQLAARSRGDGAEESGEARVRRRNAELLLRGGLHLREHRERAVLLHLTGQCRTHGSCAGKYSSSLTLLSALSRLLQERQSIIKYWLDNLRAKHGEVLHNITFLEGQPISKQESLSVWCS